MKQNQRVLLFIALFLSGFFFFTAQAQANSFLESQLNFPKVKAAFKNKLRPVMSLFKRKNVDYPAEKLLIRVFKEEKRMEVWGYSSTKNQYVMLKKYKICGLSGKEGPKMRQGDKQVPEGYYHINAFNPASNYHLSMKVSYPNLSDQIRGAGNLGGDIFIHGGCGSSGCLAITNKKVAELYVMALSIGETNPQNIPIHIFPRKMTTANVMDLRHLHPDRYDLWRFWDGLKNGFDYFERTKQLPQVDVGNDGYYVIKDSLGLPYYAKGSVM